MSLAGATPATRFSHRALLYGGDDEYLAAAVPVLRGAVLRGEPALVVTEARKVALLYRCLGPDAGKIEFADAVDWYRTPGTALGGYSRFAGDHAGAERICTIGEPVWRDLSPVEIREWKRYEAISNVAFASSRVLALCSYNAAVLPPDVVDAARRTHPWLADGSGMRPSADYQDPVAFYFACGAPGEESAPPPERALARPFGGDLGAVRAWAGQHARDLGLPAERVPDFVLALNELSTNAIQHGAGHGRISMWCEGRMLLCEVTDPGVMEPVAVQPEFLGYLPPDPTAGHGQGLWMSRQLCDLLQIRHHQPGTTVRIHMLL